MKYKYDTIKKLEAEAEKEKLFGTVSLEIHYQNGKERTRKYRKEWTEKIITLSRYAKDGNLTI